MSSLVTEGRYLYAVPQQDGLTYEFKTKEGVFVPTSTSELLVKGAFQAIPAPAKLLDLGCGIGFCGLILAKEGYAKPPVYFSDISEEAVGMVQDNAERLGVSAVIKQGSLFSPWKGERFDVIVDDVSGVSEEIARLSPWFPEGVDCQTGRDGTALVVSVLGQAAEYLNPGGLLLFPVLSLSDEDRILKAARSYFKEVSLLIEQAWFLPEELQRHFHRLERLMKAGVIRLEHKFGMWLWFTQIYKARGSKWSPTASRS